MTRAHRTKSDDRRCVWSNQREPLSTKRRQHAALARTSRICRGRCRHPQDGQAGKPHAFVCDGPHGPRGPGLLRSAGADCGGDAPSLRRVEASVTLTHLAPPKAVDEMGSHAPVCVSPVPLLASCNLEFFLVFLCQVSISSSPLRERKKRVCGPPFLFWCERELLLCCQPPPKLFDRPFLEPGSSSFWTCPASFLSSSWQTTQDLANLLTLG